MGMMLRRHPRKPDYVPMVNGKTVVEEPKKRSLTKEQKDAPKTYADAGFKPIGK